MRREQSSRPLAPRARRRDYAETAGGARYHSRPKGFEADDLGDFFARAFFGGDCQPRGSMRGADL
jgi:hypothetical protein